MMEISEFLFKFHHLEGITVGEKTKALHVFLRSCGGLEGTSTLDDILRKLDCTTFLEEKFRVDILVHFKRFKELFMVFIGGNEILIHKLWKRNWFFEQLLGQFTPEYLLNEVFKELSYVTRVRFLKNMIKFTRDENKISTFFHLTLEKYGWNNASFLLAGCSLEIIIQVLNERNVVFSNRDLIFLFKYEEQYFEYLLTLENSDKIFDFYYTNTKAFRIILGSNFELWSDIFVKNKNLKLGKRLTRKLILKNLNFIFENIDSYEKYHTRTLLKNLKSDFGMFFFKTFPESLKNFRVYSCLRTLKYYPKTKRFQLIQEMFNEIYGTSMFDHPELIEEDLLNFIDDLETREKLLECLLKRDKDDHTIFRYYGTKKSIPYLKDRITAADNVFVRQDLIKALVESCQINNDLNALLEVQNYFNFRHRNDIKSIRLVFLNEIKDRFDLDVLKENHWKYILELLKMSEIKNEKLSCYSEYYLRYIKFLYKSSNKNEIDKVLNTEFDNIITQSGIKLDFFKDIPELEKFFLMKFINEHGENKTINFEIFKAIIDWNKRHPDDFINFCQYQQIKDAVKLKITKPSYDSKNLIHDLILGKLQCDKLFHEELERIFWENFEKAYDANVVFHYLRKKPREILKYFETFMKVLLKEYDTLNIWVFIKQYDHLELPSKILDYLKSLTDICWFVGGMALATLMNPEEYSKLLTAPEIERIDSENDEESNYYRKRTELLRYARYLNNYCILVKIVDCCKGDYKEISLVPLYYYFCHSPEKILYNHIETLSTRSVTVRKHSVKLACSFLSRQFACNTITKMVETEKNQSVIENITQKTWKYFLVDRTEQSSKLVQNEIKLLDITKSEVFKEMCNIARIPEKFRMSFLELIWSILEQSEKQQINVENMKETLIHSLSSEIIEKLTYEFCSNIIRTKFLKIDENSRCIDRFITNCLKYSPEKRRILDDVFNSLNNFKNSYLTPENFNIERKARAKIDNFITNIYEDFCNDRNENEEMVRSFYSKWCQLFTPKDDVKNFMKLYLMNELLTAKDLDDYSSKISSSFKNFVENFGIVGILECFIDSLTYNLLPDHIFRTENSNEKKYELALKLIQIDNSNVVKLLALHLLPCEIPENNNCQNIFFKIMENLKKSGDDSVIINLDLFLNRLRN